MLLAEIVVYVATMTVCEGVAGASCTELEIRRQDVHQCLIDVAGQMSVLRAWEREEGYPLLIEVRPWCGPVTTSSTGIIEAEPTEEQGEP